MSYCLYMLIFMPWRYSLLNRHEFKPQFRSWITAICTLLHISGDRSATVWHLYSSTTQNQSVWWAYSTCRLTNIVIYDRWSTASALCCWKESRQIGIRTSFRALFGFRLKFLACLTVSVTVLVISAGRQSTETRRCSFSLHAEPKSFWHKLGSIRQVNVTF